METQLSLFQSPIRRKFRGNPYRNTDGKYCSKQQYEVAVKEAELHRLRNKTAYLEQKVEMYERMAMSVSKRLIEKQREILKS